MFTNGLWAGGGRARDASLPAVLGKVPQPARAAASSRAIAMASAERRRGIRNPAATATQGIWQDA
jgi:hypothetical protein